MNFAQELFILCVIGITAILTVMLNLSYITSSAKYSIDNAYPITTSELIFVVAVYTSRFIVGVSIFVAVCISHSMSVFWKWLGTLTL